MSHAASALGEDRVRRRVWWIVAGIAGVALSLAAYLAWRSSQPSDLSASEARRGSVATAVRVAEASRSDVEVKARYHGELWTEVAELAAQQTGRLETVGARLGERVKQGTVLARIDAAQLRRQIDEAEAQVNAARADEKRIAAELAAAQVQLARGQRLLSERLVAEQEIDTLDARRAVLEAEAQALRARAQQSAARVALLREQLAEASLRAPFDGAVAERFLDPGALVQPGTRVLRLVKSGPLSVRFRIPERDLNRVRAGQVILVSTQATGDEAFEGQIVRISPEVSARDRMLAVEGVLNQESELLRTGMHAEVQVTVQALSGVTVIPPGALVERTVAERRVQGVYVIEAGSAHFRAVTVLGRSGELSAVEGLETGERVVILGQAELHDGAAVSVQGERGS